MHWSSKRVVGVEVGSAEDDPGIRFLDTAAGIGNGKPAGRNVGPSHAGFHGAGIVVKIVRPRLLRRLRQGEEACRSNSSLLLSRCRTAKCARSISVMNSCSLKQRIWLFDGSAGKKFVHPFGDPVAASCSITRVPTANLAS